MKNEKNYWKIYKKFLNKYNTNSIFFNILEILKLEKRKKIILDFCSKKLILSKKNIFTLNFILNNEKPWEYILKKTFFNGEIYKIIKPIYIPKTESEFFIHFIKNKIKNTSNIIEFGSGSGVILNELSKIVKNGILIGIEIDDVAIKISNINCQKNKNIQIIKNNWTQKLQFDIKFQYIYSNPPYIINEKKIQKTTLKQSNLSLFGNKKNILDYYYELIKFAKKNLTIDGFLIFEFDETIYKILNKKKLKFFNYKIYKDYNNLIRFLVIQKKQNENYKIL